MPEICETTVVVDGEADLIGSHVRDEIFKTGVEYLVTGGGPSIRPLPLTACAET